MQCKLWKARTKNHRQILDHKTADKMFVKNLTISYRIATEKIQKRVNQILEENLDSESSDSENLN